jgi:DNA gyrase subunit A
VNLTPKTGLLVAIKEVTDQDDLMIINKSGIAIRIAVADLRVMGRNTQGVKLIQLRENDQISSVTRIVREDEEIIDADAEVIDGAVGEEQVENNAAE